MQGRLAEAEATCRFAIEHLTEQAGGEECGSHAAHYAWLAGILLQSGKLEEARRIGERGAALAREIGLSPSLSHLISIARAQGDYEAGVRFAQEELELARRHYGEEHRNAVAGHVNLALALQDAGRVDEAELHLRRAVDITAHVDTFASGAKARTLLGVLLANRGRAEEGERLCREGLELIRQYRPAEHLDVAAGLRTLGLAQRARKPDEAAESLRAALKIMRKGYPEHQLRCWIAIDLAKACRKAGRLEESVDLLSESIQFTLRNPSPRTDMNLTQWLDLLVEDASAAGRPELVELASRKLMDREGRRLRWLGALVKALNRQGKFLEAEPLACDYVELADSSQDQAWWIDARSALGATLVGTGEFEKAEALLLEAHETLQHGTPPDPARGPLPGKPPVLDEIRSELQATLVKLYQRLDEPEEVEHWRNLAGR